MKISQDLLSAMVAKIADNREKKINKNFIEQKPSADIVKKAKVYAGLLKQISTADQRKIFGYGRCGGLDANYILKQIFEAPAKKKVDKQQIRNEIVLYAAGCKRTEEVIAHFKDEMN